ncbi:MAG: T9SS type A sorting domain-containing protein [Candidatus Electryonea clarkiae]|nr:T9SS type A sorting domain-containing protein [Candidatus Electryonea clarkiae]MDP8287791.1 T9SS type A sorting domain-containing protein [Candidatus Electryonea clarkiae]
MWSPIKISHLVLYFIILITLTTYASELVTLKVYNINGREISTIYKGFAEPGRHSLVFDASNLGSGLYFYRLENGGFSSNGKLLLLK